MNILILLTYCTYQKIYIYNMYLPPGKLNHFQSSLSCSFTNKGFLFFHPPVGFSINPCLEATTSVFGKSEVIQVYEGLAERQRRNEKTLSAAANVAIEAEEEARQEGQGDKRGFMGDLVTTKQFFFLRLLETKQINKKGKWGFFLAVAHLVTVCGWIMLPKKPTYQDWRMEEGTPSWNKGKQLHSDEGNSLLQIHQVIIYSFTDPKMCFLGHRKVWLDLMRMECTTVNLSSRQFPLPQQGTRIEIGHLTSSDLKLVWDEHSYWKPVLRSGPPKHAHSLLILA